MIASLGDPAGDESTALVGMFAEDARVRLRAIGDGINAVDEAAVAFHAHSVRGSAATYGLPRVADIASRIEQQAAAGDAPGLQALLDELAAALAEGISALEAWARATQQGDTSE